MYEKTLILIKPDGFEWKNEIIKRVLEMGEIVYDKYYLKTPIEKIAKHYSEHYGTKIFDWNLEYFKGKPLEVIILQGDNIVSKIKESVGPSDPREAKPNMIRYLSKDCLKDADIEERPIKNLIHCSKNIEEAIKEIQIWLGD